MRRFIESEGVADAFKRAALNRPLFTTKKGVATLLLRNL